jgi:hypothetical protein
MGLSKANQTSFIKGMTPWNKGLTKQDERVRKNIEKTTLTRKLNNSFAGERNANWKGGVNSINNSIRKSQRMKEFNQQIIKRDNYKCILCEHKSNKLEIHHIIPLCFLIKEYQIKSLSNAYNCLDLWDMDGAVTLCKSCHYKEDPSRGKAWLEVLT